MSTRGDKTVYKSLGLCGFGMGSNSACVDVKDGKILRIRPLDYTEKYDLESFNPWKLVGKNGVTIEPKTHTTPAPLQYGYKKRVYSPNRIPFPMKRVDWDPEGERNPQTRGESKYERISWDEATTIVAKELMRLKKTYGPLSVLAQVDGHGESKVIHAAHGCPSKVLDLMGGYTLQARQPDSWEGWTWGAKHIWGMDPVGKQDNVMNIFQDIGNNGDAVIFQGGDPETNPFGWGGMMPGRLVRWLEDCGLKMIYISPDLNYTGAAHPGKWFPVLPNTDAALQCAIAYTWMVEGTYYKEHQETHAVGFDWFQRYILGGEDGVPKTPKWAEPITGIPARQIKALARYWASHNVSVAHCSGGGYIRSAYATEPARLEVALLTMQGLGRSGTGQLNFMDWGLFGIETYYPLPRSKVIPDLNSVYNGWAMRTLPVNFVPKTMVPQAIMNPPIHWSGGHVVAGLPAENQFIEWDYPQPGAAEIHAIWCDAPCWQTCWNSGYEFQRTLRHPNLEFVCVQHPWMENDTLFADIILPTCTKLEVKDISNDLFSGQYNMLMIEEKAIDYVGESLSDFEAPQLVAKKLEELFPEECAGFYDAYTIDTVDNLIKEGWANSGCQDLISFEELEEKGYYVIPTAEDWEDDPVANTAFYNDPESNPLSTPTGKVEYYSTGLAEHYPDDKERPIVPGFVPYGETHTESMLHPRSKEHPFLLITNHPRWRVHAQNDCNSWFREIETCKVTGPDGYGYEPIWVNSVDAGRLGLQNGDIVRLYNERGAVLGGVRVSERLAVGSLYQDHGARVDTIKVGELDRAGANNLICPLGTTSKNCPGEVTNGFLCNIEKVDVLAMAEEHPEQFNREYDPATGVLFAVDAVVEGA